MRLKTGGNYSKFTPDFEVNGQEYGEYQRRPRFYLGGFLSKRISEKLFFQPELHFALRRTDFLIEGVELTGHDIGSIVVDLETNITESVIAVPLIMRYYFTGSIFVDAGPQAGFILDRNEKLENDPFEQPGNPGGTTEYDFDNFDLGLSVGTGYNLTENLVINGRYSIGIIERDNNIKSSIFILGLEYRL
ncbi:MAG: porin family protein [Christiangramia sp.]|nr:porin family protein [Christiangramia sp.]